MRDTASEVRILPLSAKRNSLRHTPFGTQAHDRTLTILINPSTPSLGTVRLPAIRLGRWLQEPSFKTARHETLMDRSTDWKQHWDERSKQASSDFDFDRGVPPREKEVEDLSEQELLSFIDPKPTDVVFDAGCGTGVSILLLNSKVKQIFGVDYSQGAIDRCRRRIQSNNIENADVREGSITHIPLPDCSVDKAICMSVLQYMDDSEVRLAFTEFARILRDDGILVLHVKNLSSLYLSTLWLGKQVKLLLGKPCKLGYYRTYGWYARALTSFGFGIVDYNSFEFFSLPKMPTRLVVYLQKFELRNYTRPLLRLGWVRRHGSELKIKARLKKSPNG